MGMARVKKCWKVLKTTPIFNERVTAEECLTAMAKLLCDNYSAKHKGAVGTHSPEHYCKEMQQVILHI